VRESSWTETRALWGVTVHDLSGAPAGEAWDPVASGNVGGVWCDGQRGANAPDAVPTAEPRLARAVALAYRLPGPATSEQVRTISENWRPYRTWVTLLLRTQLEYETGEIAGGQRQAQTG